MDEKEFINKTLIDWNTAYANKTGQARVLRIILDRLERLESQIIVSSNIVSKIEAGASTSSASPLPFLEEKV